MIKTILTCFMLLVGMTAHANPYKDIPKTVQYFIPYGPGGIADLQFRDFEQYMASKGVTVVGVFKPGGNSSVAAEQFLSAPKDGSVLMLNSTSNSWLAENRLGRKVIEPITTTGGNANAVITATGSKYEKYDDFVKALQAGDPGIKIGWHAVANVLNIRQMAEKLNAPMPLLVPYKTSTDSSRDVAGGHTAVAFVPWTTAQPLIDSGKVKVIFGFSPGNASLIPDGTVNIAKKVKGWRHGELFFVGVPPGTDEKAIKAWSAIFKEYLSLKETDETFKKNHFNKDVGGPDYVRETIEQQAAAFKAYNIEMK